MLKKNDHGEAAAEFYDKRRQWLDYVCERDSISDRAFRIGYFLAKRMNGKDQCCWYTHKQIADRLSISVATVARGIAELRDEGVMIVVDNHRSPNVYYIRLPYL